MGALQFWCMPPILSPPANHDMAPRKPLKKPKPAAPQLRKTFRHTSPRLRLVLSGVSAFAVVGLMPGDVRTVTRLLTGWNVGVAIYLGMAFYIMFVSSLDDIRKRASEQDEGRIALLCLTVAAAIASLGAVIIEIGKTDNGAEPQTANFLLAIFTILLSWIFIQTIFALHYANEFYFAGGGADGGLDFPGEAELDADYWDFFYFAVVIGLTFQTSDVAIKSRIIRRTATAHALIAFIFNTVVIALTVNIAGSAI